MKKLMLTVIAGCIAISGPVFAQDEGNSINGGNMDIESRWGTPGPEGHPVLSFGVTEVVLSDRWSDTFLLELRGFKNLDNGLAIGGKVASNFDDEAELGLSFRKTLIDTFHGYGDLGYSDMDIDDGAFAELGVGAYFWRNNVMGINGGVKHYFGPSDTAFTVGFTINIY